MCRLLGYVTRSPRSLGELLGDSLVSFTALSRRHPHGWGMAWYEQDRLRVARAPEPAHASERYRELAGERRTDALLVHLRWASMNLAITTENTHPFSADQLAFAHNGSIRPVKAIEELIDPALRPRLEGTTDSERYFFAVRSAMAQAQPVDALRQVVAALRERLTFSSLNATLLTPKALLVVSEYNPEVAAQKDELHAFQLRYRVTPEAVVVASSGWPQEAWIPLGNGKLLVVERGTLATTVVDLTTQPVATG